MVSRQNIELPSGASTATNDVAVNTAEHAVEWAVNDHPAIYLPDTSFLLEGQFERVGFDLVITNPDGLVFVVADYFSFTPPPNLMLPDGIGLSPEMVAEFLHLPFDGLMFAGEATSANALEKIGEVTISIGDVRVKRIGDDGETVEVSLKRGDALFKGDELITGDRAFVKVRMLDGTQFNLGKNARASLTEFQYDESAKLGQFEATVLRGGFHYKSGKIGTFAASGRAHSKISTPSAVIGIRG